MAPIRRLTAERFLPGAARFGESPRWWQGGYVFIDLDGGEVCLLDPTGAAVRRISVGAPLGVFAPNLDGRLLVGVGARLFVVDAGDGSTCELCSIDLAPGMRLNEGRCDASGNLFVGSMSLDFSGERAHLYRVGPEGGVEVALGGIGLSNGIGFSASGGLLHHVDSLARRIDSWRIGPDGLPSVRERSVPTGTSGYPDGIAIDADGAIWVALWSAGEVHRYLADGGLDTVVAVPEAPYVTALCLGGPARRELLITTASTGPPGAAPPGAGGGALYRVEVETPGLPEWPFLCS
jgi:sugar lactone lactonase YvrE